MLHQVNMAKATALITRAAVKKMTVLSLLEDEIVDPDDKRLDCEIVAIKVRFFKATVFNYLHNHVYYRLGYFKQVYYLFGIVTINR